MPLSENIKKIREFRGFEPSEVIEGAKVKKGSYYAWEAGEYGPSDENLEKLSRFFDVSIATFYLENLTEDYLENNFSKENNTHAMNKGGLAAAEDYRVALMALIKKDEEIERLKKENSQLREQLDDKEDRAGVSDRGKK